MEFEILPSFDMHMLLRFNDTLNRNKVLLEQPYPYKDILVHLSSNEHTEGSFFVNIM